MRVPHLKQAGETAQWLYFIKDFEPRQRIRLAREQLLHLLDVVLIDVLVAEGVNKLANFQPGNMGHHMH